MPFEIIRNDITKMRVDAIINPTDKRLSGGGGLDAAIHRAAGAELDDACRALGGCAVGEAKLTPGFRLAAKYVIHTAGPVWHGGSCGERALLSACYRNSLALAKALDCQTIAFPLISAGAFGYPKDEALSVAIEAISAFLFESDATVYLVVFGRTEYLASRKLFRNVQAYIDDVYADSHYAAPSESARHHRRAAEDAAPYGNLRPDALEDAEAFAGLSDAAMPAPRADEAPRMAHKRGTPLDSARPAFDLQRALKQTDEGFSEALLRLIDERGMTDAECYKRANVDKRLFSKIRSNPNYRPSKPTVFAFAVALRLSLPETVRLLRRAGFAITHSSKFDIIMEYFISQRAYDIYEINGVLFDYDLPLLGSSAK